MSWDKPFREFLWPELEMLSASDRSTMKGPSSLRLTQMLTRIPFVVKGGLAGPSSELKKKMLVTELLFFNTALGMLLFLRLCF